MSETWLHVSDWTECSDPEITASVDSEGRQSSPATCYAHEEVCAPLQFSVDLDRITEGMQPDEVDDETFNEIVDHMENLGHYRETVQIALQEWLDD